ncbi:tetratricopeptide repeat protein [Zavarzinella formosa]|uniref:tetratricopeptide repeat protein n=1 Tax=Zavarzinella formosa TaxID=360055 RepID=UPI0002E6186D|nr:tetratricopeptide repeat protein [Zavarzinella formosa]
MKSCALLLGLALCGFGFAQEPAKTPAKSTPLSEARQRWLHGNYDEARTAFEKLLDDKEYGVPASIGLARSWLEVGDVAKARLALEAADKRTPKNPDIRAWLANLDYDIGNWDDALKTAEEVIKAEPEHFIARWVRARYYRDTGDAAKADTEMRWFVRTYSQRDNDDKPIKNPDELLIVGMAAAENARWHSLGDQFRFLINDLYPDVLKFEPDCWMAEHDIGMLLLEKYNRPEATQAFDNALKINPKAADALVGKGLVALQQFEMKEAEGFADQALKINPKLPGALRLKADVQRVGGDMKAAAKLLEAAKTINPRDEATMARLATCAIVNQKPEEVTAIIAAVKKFNPKPGLFFNDVGTTLEDHKRYSEAEGYFKQSIECRDKLPAAKAGLGMLYLRLGKEEEARTLLEQAFKGDSFNVRVSNSLKVLRHLDKYKTVTTKHYHLKFDPNTDALLASFIAEYLEEIHVQLAKDFSYEPEGKIYVELFNSHEMFSGRTVGLPDLHTIGACTGKVMAIASPNGKGLARPFNWGRVIRHELVHIFNVTQTEFQVPHWLTEGLAVRNEGSTHPPQWDAVLRERFEQNTLFNLNTVLFGFVRPKDQNEWSLAYYQSNLYVQYLIKTYGIESVGPLLTAYRDGLDTQRAIEKVCKVPLGQFEQGYRQFITDLVKSIPSSKPTVAEKPMTLAELEKAHTDKPNDVDVSARLADQYSRRRKAADARKLAEAVLTAEPGHVQASIVKARLLVAAGDEEGAQKILDEAIKKHPEDGRLIQALSRAAIESKDWTKAAELLEKGRKTSPLDGDWLPLLIDVYTKTENAEKLADVLKEHIGNDPDDLASRLKLTKILLADKKLTEAEAVAWDACRIDIKSKEAQENLLTTLEGLKKTTVAESLRKRFAGELP